MKTENNLENKAAFFAQYFYQNIQRFHTWTNSMTVTELDGVEYRGHGVNPSCINENMYLELTPLSQISDEDIDVIDLPYISIKDHLLNDIISQYEADYLRSKGYAVPWRDL